MKNIFISLIFSGLLVLSSCDKSKNTNEPTNKVDSINVKNLNKNLVSIIEIPINNFDRAVSFYQSILNLKIEKIDMGGVEMGIFPSDEKNINVVLSKGADYKPSSDGVLIYFYCADNLQPVLEKIESNGGKVLTPKTEISSEMGFFAIFIDTEGNKIGLHSYK
jgi:hypothetical protein